MKGFKLLCSLIYAFVIIQSALTETKGGKKKKDSKAGDDGKEGIKQMVEALSSGFQQIMQNPELQQMMSSLNLPVPGDNGTGGGPGMNVLENLVNVIQTAAKGVSEKKNEPAKMEKSKAPKADDQSSKHAHTHEEMKKMLESVDPNQIADFMKNIMQPDNLYDWVPLKFRAYFPDEWKQKFSGVLITEVDQLKNVFDNIPNYRSFGEAWEDVKKQTPNLYIAMMEIQKWYTTKMGRLDKELDAESKKFVEKIKTSVTRLWQEDIYDSYVNVPAMSKNNMKDSISKVFPLLEPLLAKLATNTVVIENVMESFMSEFMKMSEGLGQLGEGLDQFGQDEDDEAMPDEEKNVKGTKQDDKTEL